MSPLADRRHFITSTISAPATPGHCAECRCAQWTKTKLSPHNSPMNKEHFLGTAALAGLLPSARALAAEPARKSPGLLTVSGAVGKTNRGPVDPALDQLFAKHGVKFDKAFTLDAEALRRLPVVQIKSTLEYDAKVHALAGPLLTSVLELADCRRPARRCWACARWLAHVIAAQHGRRRAAIG